MRFSQDFIAKVEQSVDIVTVISERGIHLKRTGATYKALCPFHSEKTPSFNVNPQRGFFHCFGCGMGGSAIKFVMEYDKLSFVDTITELANRFGIPLEQTAQTSTKEKSEDRPLQAIQYAAQFFHENLFKTTGDAGKYYLQSRQVPESLQKQFLIGFIPDEWQLLYQHLYSKGYRPNEMMAAGLIKNSQKSGRPYDVFRNRVIFPIRDPRGRCIAFGGRAIQADQQPKYINSPESKYYHKSQILYGFYEGLENIKRERQLILVEGYLDVMRLHDFGFQQAVATCGTALTVEHIRFAKRYVDKIILVLDGDQAGQNAALKSCPLFLANKMDAAIVTLPPGDDPDTLLLSHGAEKFRGLLQKDKPVFEFLIQQSLAKYSSDVQGRTKAVEELLPMISEIQDENLKNLTLVHLAELIQLPASAVMEMMSKTLQSVKKYDNLQNLHSDAATIPEDRDEKWILQAILTVRTSIEFAREHLQAFEFATPHFRQIYESFLRLSDEDFQSIHIEEFEPLVPQLYPHIMELMMIDYIEGSQELLLKRSIRRVKERNLNFQFQETMNQSLTDEQKLRASVELRQQKQALDQLFPKR